MSSTIDDATIRALGALNKAEIARRLGLSRETVSSWSRWGDWHIPDEWVERFAEASGIPRDRLRSSK